VLIASAVASASPSPSPSPSPEDTEEIPIGEQPAPPPVGTFIYRAQGATGFKSSHFAIWNGPNYSLTLEPSLTLTGGSFAITPQPNTDCVELSSQFYSTGILTLNGKGACTPSTAYTITRTLGGTATTATLYFENTRQRPEGASSCAEEFKTSGNCISDSVIWFGLPRHSLDTSNAIFLFSLNNPQILSTGAWSNGVGPDSNSLVTILGKTANYSNLLQPRIPSYQTRNWKSVVLEAGYNNSPQGGSLFIPSSSALTLTATGSQPSLVAKNNSSMTIGKLTCLGTIQTVEWARLSLVWSNSVLEAHAGVQARRLNSEDLIRGLAHQDSGVRGVGKLVLGDPSATSIDESPEVLVRGNLPTWVEVLSKNKVVIEDAAYLQFSATAASPAQLTIQPNAQISILAGGLLSVPGSIQAQSSNSIELQDKTDLSGATLYLLGHLLRQGPLQSAQSQIGAPPGQNPIIQVGDGGKVLGSLSQIPNDQVISLIGTNSTKKLSDLISTEKQELCEDAAGGNWNSTDQTCQGTRQSIQQYCMNSLRKNWIGDSFAGSCN
jgi:hypothetical protein